MISFVIRLAVAIPMAVVDLLIPLANPYSSVMMFGEDEKEDE